MQQATFNVLQDNTPAYHQTTSSYYVQANNPGQIVSISKQDELNHASALSSVCDWESFMNELEYE
jgi:hypothetical protein